jgi:MFS family permease
MATCLRTAATRSTLLIAGLATFAVGFVPGYDTIGIWGAVILTIIRFIRGIGVGGVWGGSVLLAMEWARTNKHRGFITSWPQFGGPAGLLLANLAVLVFSAISGDQFVVRDADDARLHQPRHLAGARLECSFARVADNITRLRTPP